MPDNQEPASSAEFTLTVFLPGQPGRSFPLHGGRSYSLGRSSGADIRLEHAGVSRIHLLIEPVSRGWRVTDQVSKNGTRLAGHPVNQAVVTSTTWLEVGGIPVLLDFRRSDDETSSSALESARAGSNAARGEDSARTILERAIAEVRRLSGCERVGVWLTAADRQIRPAPGTPEFRPPPSLTAICNAVSTGRSAFCSDTDGALALASSGSIASGGIRAVMTIPVKRDDAVVAVVYADSLVPGKLFTEHDAALLTAAARQLSLVVATGRIRGEIDSLRQEL